MNFAISSQTSCLRLFIFWWTQPHEVWKVKWHHEASPPQAFIISHLQSQAAVHTTAFYREQRAQSYSHKSVCEDIQLKENYDEGQLSNSDNM